MNKQLHFLVTAFAIIFSSVLNAGFSQCTGTTLPDNTAFEGTFAPPGFTLNNPDAQYTWEKLLFAVVGRSGDTSRIMGINFYNYQNAGQLDELITIPYDLTGTATPKLQFDVAYSRYDQNYFDGLQVLISTDCGATFPDTIYDKSGDDAQGNTLPTVPDQGDNNFIPNSYSHWRLEVVDLTPYIGSIVVLKFRAINGWGNNLFIDNILVGDCDVLPGANAGSDQTVCKDATSINLNGSITANATGNFWAGGKGTYSPDSTALNATYSFSVNDIASVLGIRLAATKTGCAPAYDFLTVNRSPLPTVNAGSDTTICASTSASLNGVSTNNSGITWTTSGTGTFTNAAALNPTYMPSAADTTMGNVTLTLTATGITPCPSSSDDVIITFKPDPKVNAGADQTICSGVNASLNGIVNTTGGAWSSSGTGSFLPDNLDLNASYSPSPADGLAGSVTLTLTTTGNAPCSPTTDDVTINITADPVVNAGSDQTICSGADATLNGSVDTGTPTWSTSGTGIFTPNTSALNASYTPSAGDIAAGTVTLTLTSTPSTCSPVSDNVTITVSACTGITSGLDNRFSIYPNPAKESFTISDSKGTLKEATIELLNIHGSVVYRQHVNEVDNTKINISEFSKGVYYLKISGSGFSEIKKIVVE